MPGSRFRIDKSTENAVHEILNSRAESRIYLFLLRKNGARSEDIIKGTKLHPSTVRELLSKMHDQKVIYRQKLKNENIGKNPYFYQAVSPLKLIRKKAKELEKRLNKLAMLTQQESDNDKQYVKIKILKGRENA
jgi:predicted transcriptional regulator